MAKFYNVSLTRTTVETATLRVEAGNKQEAVLRAAQQIKPDDFQLRSTATDLGEVEYRETIGSEE